MVKVSHQGVDDLIRLDVLPRSNLIDERAAIDQPLRETRCVWNILLELNDGGVDVSESGLCQRILNRIERIREGHTHELRWIVREEASHDFVRNSAERIMLMRIPDAKKDNGRQR